MKGLDKRVRSVLETSLIVIGNEAKNHFVNSFRLQGFEDKTVEKWKPRKKKEAKGRGSKKSAAEAGTVRSVKAGRAILVKSGDLRRSIRRESINKASLKVVIGTDVPYAKIHNEGFRGTEYVKPHRRFVDQGDKMGTGVFSVKTRKEKMATVKIKQDVKGYSRKMNMPKRQFIGGSYVLNTKVKKTITKSLDRLFKK
jgi:phage gpG-like protein